MKTATEFDVGKGSQIKCNDPRYGWTVTVDHVFNGRAYFLKPGGGRQLSVMLARIYTDGKDRHQGYNLVTAE